MKLLEMHCTICFTASMALPDTPEVLPDLPSPKSIDIQGDKFLLSPGETESNLLRASPRNSLVDITFGREYAFVEQPPHAFFCPVTLELLVDPHQTECCGNHISSEAATRLRKEGKVCPLCNDPNFITVRDKHYCRRVLDLRVYCPHDGCNWIGEVRYHNPHIKDCPKRSWDCQYCDLTCTYEEGESVHWPECEMFPEPCPNDCEVRFVPRKDIEEHRTVCSMEPVACELSEYGCNVVLPRKELVEHMKENEGQHLIILAINSYKQLKLNGDAVIGLRQNQQLLQRSVQCMQRELADLRNKTNHIEHHAAGGNCSSCTIHSFSNFSQLKLCERDRESKPFRIKSRGYLFNFRIRFYKPPFDLVVAFLGLLSSSDDDDLVWPVKIACQVEQLNQAGDHGHKKFNSTFTWRKDERGVWRTIDSYEMKYCDLEKKKPTLNYVLNDTLVYRLHLDIVP